MRIIGNAQMAMYPAERKSHQRNLFRMNLSRALRLPPSPNLAFAGAGGKTTALFQLARELSGDKKQPVIVTATTHLGAWQIPLADQHIIAESPAPLEEIEHNLRGVSLITGPMKGDKTTPITQVILKWLRENSSYHDLPLLIEADGARQRPIKAPAAHEPAIPEFVEQVVYVAGLAGLEKSLTEEHVHRAETFARLSGLKNGEIITPEALTSVLSHPEGGLKNIPSRARRAILLNQADTPELQAAAQAMTQALLMSFDAAVIASLDRGRWTVDDEQRPSVQSPTSVYAVHEPVAGIILAAGESKRFGQPKQLLNWRGQPFVRAVARTALEAGLSPVVVVTGASAEQVEAAVKDLPVSVVRNKEWQSGQSSSIRAGLTFLTSNPSPSQREGKSGAAVFLLADQPQIPAAVVRAMIQTHSKELCPIVAPLVLMEHRGNPVLFDRATFPDLSALKGDVGGRAIFSKHKVDYLPWHDDRLLLDVDRPQDYERLIADDTP